MLDQNLPSLVDASVLVVADKAGERGKLRELLERHGFRVGEARQGGQALMSLRESRFNAVVLDLHLPDMDSYDVLRQAAGMDCSLPIILLEASVEPRCVVGRLKAGAYSVCRQGGDDDLVLTVLRAVYENHPELCLRELSSSLEGRYPLQQVMGWSSKIAELARDVARVAPTDFSVLIVGETGTGKEIVARAIHRLSLRHKARLVAIDCGAIPDTLIENELFGHERGAFTGAAAPSLGKFQSAANGTLLLDEVGNLPVGMQGALLRALEQRRFYRVGGSQPVSLEARIIAATNCELIEVGHGEEFRSDLYHRLAEYVIRVPPLAARREDITFLARRFLNQTNRELGKSVRGFTLAAQEALWGYDWPGNVRELRNVVRRAVLVAREVIDTGHLLLPGVGTLPSPPPSKSMAARPESNRLAVGERSLKDIVARATREIERLALSEALEQTKGNKAAAARLLRIDYKTIHSKLRRYGIRPRAEDRDLRR